MIFEPVLKRWAMFLPGEKGERRIFQAKRVNILCNWQLSDSVGQGAWVVEWWPMIDDSSGICEGQFIQRNLFFTS